MKLYLDNAATTWPKPSSVVEAISKYLNEYAGSPGRAGHQFAIRAAREVFETRELIANLFNSTSSERVIFSANATQALNIAIKGILKKGDHVIISHMEHNSVIRPLRYLEKEGIIEITIIDCNKKEPLNIEQFKNSFKSNTKLVVTIHGSNVTGTLFPIKQIGALCKSKNILYLLDAAQTAGIVPIDMQKENIDILVFSGHKKLYGPPGIGGLCIKNDIYIESLIQGGTGSLSEKENHPEFYPDHLEAGTMNTLGIVGLKAGVQYLLEKGIENLQNKQLQLTKFFIEKLKEIEPILIYGPEATEERLPLISLNIRNIISSELAYILDKDYGIMVRAGLHCSPLAHQSINTLPQGSVRFSLGCFTTEEDIKYTIEAIKKIIHKI